MAATDYIIVTGFANAYLAKKKKPTKNGPQTMSQDRPDASAARRRCVRNARRADT